MSSISSHSAPIDPSQQSSQSKENPHLSKQFQEQLGGMMAAIQEEEKRVRRKEDLEKKSLEKKDALIQGTQDEDIEDDSDALAKQLANIQSHLQQIQMTHPDLAESLETIIDEKLDQLG